MGFNNKPSIYSFTGVKIGQEGVYSGFFDVLGLIPGIKAGKEGVKGFLGDLAGVVLVDPEQLPGRNDVPGYSIGTFALGL